jgi:hypothetical protein
VNVDTGAFRALTDRVAQLEKRTDAIADHLREDAMLAAAMRSDGIWDAGLKAPAGRHAAPRRDRHGLRLVGGTGGSHAAGGAR